jgi:hypothetical protein
MTGSLPRPVIDGIAPVSPQRAQRFAR